ncbi:hypothetical protein N7486_010172 [Penicillium sp. IBT 16267x]|nr:hypothetical protein N7486_010172 [Penicillium sp. IBT 16267x]
MKQYHQDRRDLGLGGTKQRAYTNQYGSATFFFENVFLETSMSDGITGPYSVTDFRSNLVDLALSGALHEISGMLVGRGYKYDRQMQDEIAGVIAETFDSIVPREPEELPIAMNVDFVHTSPFLTLPIGALAQMNSRNDEFMILEPGVQA